MQHYYPALLSRLDRETSLLVDEIVDVLPKRHPDVLAIILYGSVARREERALDEPDPSDVDILVVIDAEDKRRIYAQWESLFETLGSAKMHHLEAGRDVNVMFASRTAQEWDETFIENVRRDGIILYQRVSLPAAFAG